MNKFGRYEEKGKEWWDDNKIRDWEKKDNFLIFLFFSIRQRTRERDVWYYNIIIWQYHPHQPQPLPRSDWLADYQACDHIKQTFNLGANE